MNSSYKIRVILLSTLVGVGLIGISVASKESNQKEKSKEAFLASEMTLLAEKEDNLIEGEKSQPNIKEEKQEECKVQTIQLENKEDETVYRDKVIEKNSTGEQEEKIEEGIQEEKIEEGIQEEKIEEGIQEDKIEEEIQEEKIEEGIQEDKIEEEIQEDKIEEEIQEKEDEEVQEDLEIEQVGPSQKMFEDSVLTLVNEQRRAHGLGNLKMEEKLRETARLKASDMSQNNYFDHISPRYGTPFQMLDQFGIRYTAAAENIAQGYPSPEAVVEGWMRSVGHRENILNPMYTHIGIGYDNKGNYWTQLFIAK